MISIASIKTGDGLTNYSFTGTLCCFCLVWVVFNAETTLQQISITPKMWNYSFEEEGLCFLIFKNGYKAPTLEVHSELVGIFKLLHVHMLKKSMNLSVNCSIWSILKTAQDLHGISMRLPEMMGSSRKDSLLAHDVFGASNTKVCPQLCLLQACRGLANQGEGSLWSGEP